MDGNKDVKETAGLTLQVLNPRGERDPSAARGISPRLSSLEGKKIGMYWNGKPDGDYYWDTIEGMLKREFPSVTVLRYNGPGDLGEAFATQVAKEIDAFFYGVGD
ncbi:MAG: hypothetical protein ABSD38_15490 [Syntrophorhabdales bacterium]|jgi:hypothetical protein